MGWKIMSQPIVIFTFDDGWVDGFSWQAWCGKHATFFILPGLHLRDFRSKMFGDEERRQVLDPNLTYSLMTKKQIHLLIRRGCEIGSHGFEHLKYDLLEEEEVHLDLRYSEIGMARIFYPNTILAKSFSYPGQHDGHRELVRGHFPYIRPNMGFTNPMEFPNSVYLYMWHRGIEQSTPGNTMCLCCETEKLKEQDARFVTFRQACEEELINDY